MSDENSNAPAAAPEVAQPPAAAKEDAPMAPAQEDAAPAESKPAAEPAAAANASAPAAAGDSGKPAEASTDKPADAPAEKADVEMTDSAAHAEAPAADADESTAAAAVADTATPSKAKATPRRKSVSGAAESKGKKLNKKASKARILHLDAQPGDHYFVKLKGFPQWPVIICDEDMLPASLIKSRPVTAKRVDGTYRDDYADGAKKAGDRTFPVMYLSTNEFGWVPNSDLIDLDPATVMDVKMDKMRKDLQLAHELASQSHPLSHYKELLQQFQEELIEQEMAKEAKAAKTPKGKKAKAAVDEDGDVEMEDAAEEDGEPPKEKKSAKKRKVEDTAETPARSDSVKRPKIKLTMTPKTNGAAPPNATTKAAEPKASKPKAAKKTKDTEEKKAEKEPTTPKDPKLTAEEKHQRKEKEVLFLRHKLQKGLLTRDQEPKEEEMQGMSDYIKTLETLPDLEVSIIRATKINKVLKAILKLDNIPKEEEFQLKSRSQTLLDKWNKLLATDGTAGAGAGAAPAEGANGVNGTKEAAKTNGVKKSEAAPEKDKDEPKEQPKGEPKEAAQPEAAAAEADGSGEPIPASA